MKTVTTKLVRMVRRRKDLDPARLNERFGLHIRGLIETAGLTVAELRKRMSDAGFPISEQGIRNWTRGERYPPPEVMEALAKIFGLPDYRHVLPPPFQKSRRK